MNARSGPLHPPVAYGGADRWILVSAALLVTLGTVMVLSTSYFQGHERFASPYHFLWKHLLAVAVGTASLALAARLPSALYRGLAYPLAGATLILLAAVLVLPSHGAVARWIHAGSLSFQPSELAKVALVLFTARSVARDDDARPGVARPLVFGTLVIGLIGFEPDFGTAAFLGFALWAMLFVARARWTHLGALAGLGVVALATGVLFAAYRSDRIEVFLDPWQHRQGKGFQIVQSLLAFGAGGFTGVGLGAGQQKMFYLPAAHTDFIFAVMGEELGLCGTSLVLALFVVLGYRSLRIALGHPSCFGRLLAFGLTLVIVSQAAVNMGVATAILPTKGLSLPLLSYGGSGMVVTLACVGMLLSLSREMEGEVHVQRG